MSDKLNTTSEISKLLKYSTWRVVFEKLKSQLAPNLPDFRTLCGVEAQMENFEFLFGLVATWCSCP